MASREGNQIRTLAVDALQALCRQFDQSRKRLTDDETTMSKDLVDCAAWTRHEAVETDRRQKHSGQRRGYCLNLVLFGEA
jgi:hypothetical protein